MRAALGTLGSHFDEPAVPAPGAASSATKASLNHDVSVRTASTVGASAHDAELLAPPPLDQPSLQKCGIRDFGRD